MELVAAAQLLGLVAVERDVKRSALGETHLLARLIIELRGKTRPASQRLEVEFEDLLLAPGRLADGGEHARGDTGRPRRGTIALEHAHPRAALGRSPRTGEPDHAAADEDRVVSIVCFSAHRPPCAGITRIRFGRSAALQPPSQPLVGSRYVSIVPTRPLI